MQTTVTAIQHQKNFSILETNQAFFLLFKINKNTKKKNLRALAVATEIQQC